MDLFKQQEMAKSRPQVNSKLNEWRDWLVSHVPKTIKNKAYKTFTSFKKKRLWDCIKRSEEKQKKTI